MDMLTAPAALQAVSFGGNGDDDGMHHLTCCDDDTAMCGKDVAAVPFCDEGHEDPPCPVCAYVKESGLPCPVSGCTWGAGAAAN